MTPRKSIGTKQTAFRLPPELIRRLDRLADLYARERPGMAVTRSDVAVQDEEMRHGKTACHAPPGAW